MSAHPPITPALPPLSADLLHKLKEDIQGFLAPGLVIIVGSGLSAAEGISGMPALAAHLLATIPPKMTKGHAPAWTPIEAGLRAGRGLEEVLLAHPPTPELEKLIVDETASLVRRDEAAVLREVVAQRRMLRLSRLLRQFSPSSDPIDVVTPNYERLVEFAAEDAGLRVETMFVGESLGRFDEQACRLSFIQKLQPWKKSIRKVMAPRIRLCKPHGSLDWCMRGGKPTCISPDFIDSPLIITPGLNKYRHGYDVPFDRHRERANASIDEAQRFLVIGYGFNDAHLETHLSPAIRSGRPTVIVTHTLSPTARNLAGTCRAVVALEHHVGDTGASGTAIWRPGGGQFLAGAQIWDLGELVKEVFGG